MIDRMHSDSGTGHTVVLSVTFVARDGFHRELRKAAEANASASRVLEPGCLQFDLIQLDDGSGLMFCEQFVDPAALQAHYETEHYRRWKRAVDEYVRPGSMVKNIGRLLPTAPNTASPTVERNRL